jgi:hypothetical protein
VRIPAWERENFRLNKVNIFPSRKSLVSDIPAGEGKTAKPLFTVRDWEKINWGGKGQVLTRIVSEMAEMTGSFHEKRQATSAEAKKMVREGETGKEYYES